MKPRIPSPIALSFLANVALDVEKKSSPVEEKKDFSPASMLKKRRDAEIIHLVKNLHSNPKSSEDVKAFCARNNFTDAPVESIAALSIEKFKYEQQTKILLYLASKMSPHVSWIYDHIETIKYMSEKPKADSSAKIKKYGKRKCKSSRIQCQIAKISTMMRRYYLDNESPDLFKPTTPDLIKHLLDDIERKKISNKQSITKLRPQIIHALSIFLAFEIDQPKPTGDVCFNGKVNPYGTKRYAPASDSADGSCPNKKRRILKSSPNVEPERKDISAEAKTEAKNQTVLVPITMSLGHPPIEANTADEQHLQSLMTMNMVQRSTIASYELFMATLLTFTPEQFAALRQSDEGKQFTASVVAKHRLMLLPPPPVNTDQDSQARPALPAPGYSSSSS